MYLKTFESVYPSTEHWIKQNADMFKHKSSLFTKDEIHKKNNIYTFTT